jgi:TDG/mug DNA glycosylase family protein
MTPPGNGPDHEIRIDRPAAGSHRTTVLVDGRAIDTLEDLPPLRNRLLFVGLNPSPVSVEAGHYHQGPLGRLFWARLIEAHILPAGIGPEAADDALLAEGHGITDLLKRPSARDDASDNALRAGVGPLWQKIAIWRPAAVVFIYKRAAQIAAGRRLDAKWGQLHGVALAGRPCFLMPGPDAPKPQVDAGLNFLRNLGSALPYD